MKNILLILLILSTPAFGSQIQIYAVKGDGVVVGYKVKTWNGPDRGEITTQYTAEEAQSKFSILVSKTESGLSKIPDRAFLNYNDATGELVSIDYQVTEGSFDRFLKGFGSLSTEAKNESEICKDDIEVKTGKNIDGK